MGDSRNPDSTDPSFQGDFPDEPETVLTTPEDVASAGRSCMAIVVLAAVVVLVLVLWVVYRALGGE